ncbi:MAG: XdhC family protein [Chloroflexota bacterium]
MRDLLATIDAWQAEGQAIGRAVVVRTFGSAPRPEGATLLLSEDGRLAGSVSGGCVEGATAEHVEEARRSGLMRVVRFGISDERAWDVGLACGGTIDILIEPALPVAVVEAARAVQTGRSGGRAVVTRLPDGSPGPQKTSSQEGRGARPEEPMIVFDDGRLVGSLGSAGADEELVSASLSALDRGRSQPLEVAGSQLFIEAYPVRPRLVIIGAVPVAMALVGLAHDLGYQTVVIDGRPVFATDERFPNVDELLLGWPDEMAVRIGLGPGDAVAVLSHDPKFDEPAIAEALQRGCRYVGAIGSRKTQRNRHARLLERGVSEADLERLRGPIGLDLGGREPAEIALAIMSEIVAAKYDASAHSMRDIVAQRGRP